MANNENSKPMYTFAPHTITCNGQEFPAEYSINPTSGHVYAFLTIQERGKPVSVKLKVTQSEAEYAAILQAAQQEREERNAGKQAKEPAAEAVAAGQEPEAAQPEAVVPVTVLAKDPDTVAKKQPAALAAYWEKRRAQKAAQQAAQEPEAEPTAEPVAVQAQEPKPMPVQAKESKAVEPVTVEPVAVAQDERDPKQARGPVPDKNFVGKEIAGNGWKILFDAAQERTRVIFEGEPTKAALVTVEKAGFYWSTVMQSFNKKLTFKAYRAAQALALDLRAVCG
ncbi:MAG: hypothetical protein GXY67_07760 [Clostridiales bacterium]|nr:hypothetical protein [Clostridiales bacterium]